MTNRRPGQATVRAAGRRALGLAPVAEAVRRINALRGRSLVLVYHRLTDEDRLTAGVVPSIPSDLFRKHAGALGDVGTVVPLPTLVHDGRRAGRPRFALTFDDDLSTHVERALPILTELALPATFFLSGRSLHGLGPYWFEILEDLIDRRGSGDVGHLLGVESPAAHSLVDACERDESRRKVVEGEAHGSVAGLDRTAIQTLAQAGMDIGFHTLHHEVLTELDDRALAAALTEGRDELALAVGRPLSRIAYPHGKADRRVAERVSAAGYEAAWTGRPGANHRRTDPFMLGRWEPGPIGVDDLLVGVARWLSSGGGR
jgi:peptidoglycan/xylan/chitin deacetylase (PgdA/CDA1 family)